MPQPPTARIHDTTITWLSGGVLIERDGAALVLDAPPGIAGALSTVLPAVRGVVLSGGRIQSVGGLVELLVDLMPHRADGVPLSLWVPLGEERGAMLAESWVRGWGASYPLTVDAVAIGEPIEHGDFFIELLGVLAGEPRWRERTVERVVGAAVRVRTLDACIAWVPGAAPGHAVRRACEGADLAIVECGVRPWPRVDRRWRMTPHEALDHAGDAPRIWVVRDDGSFGIPDEN